MEKIAEVLQQQFAAQQQKFEELQQRNEEQMKLMRTYFKVSCLQVLVYLLLVILQP